MDGKQAAEQERINMKALQEQVYLTFTGEEGIVENGKVVPSGNKCLPGQVLRLGFLGNKYEFAIGDEKLVPLAAAKQWIQDSLNTWEHKVVFTMRDAEKYVAAGPNEAEIRAKVEAELKEKYEADLKAKLEEQAAAFKEEADTKKGGDKKK